MGETLISTSAGGLTDPQQTIRLASQQTLGTHIGAERKVKTPTHHLEWPSTPFSATQYIS